MSSGESLGQPIRVAAGTWHVTVKGKANFRATPRKPSRCDWRKAGKEIARSDAQLRFLLGRPCPPAAGRAEGRVTGDQKDLETIRIHGGKTSLIRKSRGRFWKTSSCTPRKTPIAARQDAHSNRLATSSPWRPGYVASFARRWPAGTSFRGSAVDRHQQPVVRGSSFVGPVRLPRAAPLAERPVFFNGYGHFGQIVADMEKWPHLARHRPDRVRAESRLSAGRHDERHSHARDATHAGSGRRRPAWRFAY